MAAECPTHDEMWALLQQQQERIERQEREIESLRAELKSASLRPVGREVSAFRPSRKLSRGGLLKGAAAAVAGVMGAAALESHPAAAAGTVKAPGFEAQGLGFISDAGPFVAKGGGQVSFQNVGSPVTGALLRGNQAGLIANSTHGVGVHGTSQSGPTDPAGNPVGGIGVQGDSNSGVGVYGTATTGTGVRGQGSSGVVGVSPTFEGVRGFGAITGVFGEGQTGVHGLGSSQGVVGAATTPTADGVGVTGVSIEKDGQGGIGTGVVGQSTHATGVQGISQGAGTGGIGVHGTSQGQGGIGVQGDSAGGTGVQGQGSSGVVGISTTFEAVRGFGATTGVFGSGQTGVHGLGSNTGVVGAATAPTADSVGMRGVSIEKDGQGGIGIGVVGESSHSTGVQGICDGIGAGVVGTSNLGRGGIFSGAAAQLQLTPSTAAAPPTSGQTGDLFLDSQGRLWVCAAGGPGAVWKTYATISDPIVNRQSQTGVAAITGETVSGDQATAGVRGQALHVSGTTTSFGQGIGVLGESSFIGVKGDGGAGGKGGFFTGNIAQLHLEPVNRSAPIAGLGDRGDIVVTADGDIWICEAPAQNGAQPVWTRLLKEGRFVLGSSRVASIGGVRGENLSGDAQSAGVLGWGLDINPSTDVIEYGSGIGVLGQAQGIGVKGQSLQGPEGSQTVSIGIGVLGESDLIGVKGDGNAGRGGVFAGNAAQIQLIPSTAAGPTRFGSQGDLFLDSSANLWICTQSSTRAGNATWGKVTLTFP